MIGPQAMQEQQKMMEELTKRIEELERNKKVVRETGTTVMRIKGAGKEIKK